MADVRSMLRNERTARRINHPQAQYTPGGLLVCKACHIQLKSDSLWQTHISSTAHVNALKSLASGLMAQQSSKKRKADEDDDEEVTENSRKRAKGTEPAKTNDKTASTKEQVEETQASKPVAAAIDPPLIDEDEWAAFEREVAQSPPPDAQSQEMGIPTGAVISAAPMSAAELAAKSRQEQSIQAKERREAEIEGEREDAQRRLDEEFDEMEELEARVRRLKEQREALRQNARPNITNASAPANELTKPDESGSESDDSEDESWDNWGRL